MDGAVLSDDGAGIDGDDVAVGEGFADDAQGFRIVFGLSIDGRKDGSVQNQEIGVGRRQAFIQFPFFLLPPSGEVL